MKKVRCVVISGYGTNCEVEMAYACKLAGGEVEIVHISELIYGEKSLDNYHFLNFPGGFLDGDDLGAAKAAANRWRFGKIKTTGEPLFDQIMRFIKEGKLILGVCNGFQLMVKLGILPGLRFQYALQLATPCVFTQGLDKLYLPVRHGEGKFVVQDENVLTAIENNHLAVLKYTHPETEQPTMEYPFNPNGSVSAIAGICDPSGRLFGLMPHPEAFLHFTNHPHWTREQLSEEGMGLALFHNAITYIKQNIL